MQYSAPSPFRYTARHGPTGCWHPWHRISVIELERVYQCLSNAISIISLELDNGSMKRSKIGFELTVPQNMTLCGVVLPPNLPRLNKFCLVDQETGEQWYIRLQCTDQAPYQDNSAHDSCILFSPMETGISSLGFSSRAARLPVHERNLSKLITEYDSLATVSLTCPSDAKRMARPRRSKDSCRSEMLHKIQ